MKPEQREVFVSWRDCVLERMRVLTVAGIWTGALVAGLGSRLAMFLLRVTSPDRVIGIQSDDDFTIGEFSFGGTYNLMLIGAAAGILGVGVYRMVHPWLIGPHWFRRATLGIAAGIVVGSMLVHADGVDFTLLQPTWLAISTFIVLPALFAVAVGAAVDSVSRPESWTARGRWRWLLPIISIACFPISLFLLGFAVVITGVWALARDADPVSQMKSVRWLPLVVRSAWVLIVVLGLVALLNDVTAIV